MSVISRFINLNQHSQDDLVREQKFFEFIGSYVCQIQLSKSFDENDFSICLLASSPKAPVAMALKAHGETIKSLGISVNVIFSDVSNQAALEEFCQSIRAGSKQLVEVRSIKNKSLLDAHEQLILGSVKCWSGDTLRRKSAKSNIVELFIEDQPEDVRLARMAFSGMWAATETVAVHWMDQGSEDVQNALQGTIISVEQKSEDMSNSLTRH